MLLKTRLAGLLAAAFLCAAPQVSASDLPTDPLVISLVDGGYGSAGTVLMGLKIAMPDGWHTYWKSPGEGGLGPALDTSASTNLGSLELKWPLPARIDIDGVKSLGYGHEVLIPMLVKPVDPSKDVDVDLALTVYACKDYCMAFERHLAETAKPGARDLFQQKAIATALSSVPRSHNDFLSVSAPARLSDGSLAVSVLSPRRLEAPDIFVDTPGNLTFGTTWKADNARSGTFTLVPAEPAKMTAGTPVNLTVVDSGESVETAATVPGLRGADTRLGWGILLTALIGGLVLNVMPCVFPVISLKLMGLTAGDTRAVRRSFAASSLGIVASFVALGGALALFKLAGAQIGWGVQFQSATFLWIMAGIVFLFGAGTAGLFEIALPSGIATRLTAMTDGHGFGVSVAQGFVATLLATPCSAPFVGTAVGFALAGTSLDILLVFLAMGVGMALPYLAVSAFPYLSRVLPKPGRWMTAAKTLFALALFATSGWLAMVAVGDMRVTPPLAAALVACVSIVATAAARRKGMLTVILCLAAFVAPTVVAVVTQGRGGADGIAWTAFSPGGIAPLVRDGKTVFVNVTADWCVTCKVNDRRAFSDAGARAALSRAVAMKADWTKSDPEISAFLRKNGRFGIPFTVVYSKAHPDGQPLPELLSAADIVEAIP